MRERLIEAHGETMFGEDWRRTFATFDAMLSWVRDNDATLWGWREL